jgi:hypothetical protein
MIAKMDAWIGKLEANQEKSYAVAKYQAVPDKEAAMELLEHWRIDMGTSI